MLQNQNTTSHDNTFPVEHEWESLSVASGNKEESLLALVNSSYLQTSPFHGFSPFQCGWIFECSNSPLSPSVSRVTGWDEGLRRLKWVWNFPKFLFFPPCLLCEQNGHFSWCYVLIQLLFRSLSSMKFGSHHTKFQCQKSSELNHSPSSKRAKQSCILNREKLERNKVLALLKWQDIECYSCYHFLQYKLWN